MGNTEEVVFAYINEIFTKMEELDSQGHLLIGNDPVYANWAHSMRGFGGGILIDSQVLSFLLAFADRVLKKAGDYKRFGNNYAANRRAALYYKNSGGIIEDIVTFDSPPPMNRDAAVRPTLNIPSDFKACCSLVHQVFLFQNGLTAPAPRRLIEIPKDVAIDRRTPDNTQYNVYSKVIHAFWVMLQLYVDQPRDFSLALVNMLNFSVDEFRPWWKCCFISAKSWIQAISEPIKSMEEPATKVSSDYVPQIINSFVLMNSLIYENEILYGENPDLRIALRNNHNTAFSSFLDATCRCLDSFWMCHTNNPTKMFVNYELLNIQNKLCESASKNAVMDNSCFNSIVDVFKKMHSFIVCIKRGEFGSSYELAADYYSLPPVLGLIAIQEEPTEKSFSIISCLVDSFEKLSKS